MKSTKTTTSALTLYLIALLAVAYLFVWWALGLRPPSSSTTLEDDRSQAPPAVRGQRSVIWYAELPPAERPLLQLPKGWRIVTPTAVAAYEAPPVVRVVPSRPKRIRTRSS